MAFSIFCVGNGGYHFNQSRLSTIGDLYDIRDSMDMLSTGVTEGIGEVIQGQIEGEVMPDTDYAQMANRAEDSLINQHYFIRGITQLQILTGNKRLTLAARNPGILYDDTGFASVELFYDDSAHDAANYVARAFQPALAAAGLNGAGVLGYIGIAMSNFFLENPAPFPRADSHWSYMLNFDLAQA